MKRSLVISILTMFAIICTASFPENTEAETGGFFKYQSPVAGATLVSPGTSLIFRTGSELESRLNFGIDRLGSLIEVTGSLSGRVDGDWKLSADRATMTFRPRREFTPGETVTITLYDPVDGTRSLYSSSFEIKSRVVDHLSSVERQLGLDEQLGLEESGESVVDEPGDEIRSDDQGTKWDWKDKKKKKDDEELLPLPDDFPVADITVTGETAPGYLFLTNNPGKGGKEGRYLMILDDTGYPEYFRKMAGQVLDFKVQPNRTLSYFDGASNHFQLMDDTYTVIDSFTTEGYPVDVHDFILTPEGHALLFGEDPNIVDMSALVAGGDTAANVVGHVIQEFDPEGNLIFEWRTADHFDILDTNVDLTGRNIRYCHVNAVEFDHDGNILISSRHMSEITKIDRETGEVIWRMGGPNNQFELVGDTRWFSRQHDIRRLPDGHVTLFDNGNLNDPQESRALEYELDEVNMVATMVWEFRNEPATYGSSRGSTRRLSNGNTIIGWGSGIPDATEVAYDGTKVMDLSLPGKNVSYRTFRFPWEGKAAVPTVWIEKSEDRITLWFRKFGDDDVARYYLYGGDHPNPTRRIGVSTDNSIDVHELIFGMTYYFRVTSVDRWGVESPYSEQVVYIDDIADSHFVHDCDLKVTPRALNLDSNGRWVTAHISFPDSTGLDVSEIDVETVMLNGSILLDRFPEKKNHVLKFSREELVDLLGSESGRVPVMIRGVVGEDSFMGFDTICVFQGFDSSSCYCDEDDGEDPEIDDDDPAIDDPAVEDPRGEDKPDVFVVHQNYPNPFNPVTRIRFDLPARTHVNLSVFDINGRLVATLVDRDVEAGSREISWNGMNNNGDRVVSGVYFYKLSTPEKSVTRKMILLR